MHNLLLYLMRKTILFMKKNVLIVFLSLLLFSCNKPKPVPNSTVTPNQQKIASWYDDVNYLSKVEGDSLTYYAIKMEKAAQNEPNEYKAMATLVRGISFANFSSYERALKEYEKAQQLLKNSKADSLKGRVFNCIGSYYKNRGNYPMAFESYYKALRIFEKLQNTTGISSVNANMGQIYQQKNDLAAAEHHLKIAIKALAHKKTSPVYLSASHHLANVYGMKGDYKSALAIDEEGIKLADKVNSILIKVTFLDNKANCMMYSGQLDSAQYYFNECLKLDLLNGNKKQIGDSYSNLGQLALFRNDFATAEKQTLKSIEILKSIKHKHNLSKSYKILTDIYSKQKKFEKALKAQEDFYEEYQQMIDEKKEDALAEYNIVYETQKKEKLLAENKIELLQNQAESKQKNITIVILVILALFIGIVGFLIYRQQKLQSHQREQEFQLKTAISQIETQNKLQQQRLSISRDLHDNIGAQLTFIISSVDTVKYGFDLKNSKLSNKLDSISDFTKSTIIELRDTIWAMNNNQISFEDLRARIFNFIEKAKIAREDIHFKFNIDDNLNEITLTSIQGINIYRTIQEALNNIIKYAEATEIVISAEMMQNHIHIQVRDNGKGFDSAEVEKGNGMLNMRKRIEDIGGSFKIESTISEGTYIRILISIVKSTESENENKLA